MTLRMRSEDNNDLPFTDFDPSQIFIGREQEQNLFKMYLNGWKKLIFDAELDDTLTTTAPSPNNKIQSLVVLLYGRGGFGKSTLLSRYRDIILEENQIPLFGQILPSKIVDWEFAIGDERSLFNLPKSQDIDSGEYFRMLCGQLAIVLDKKPKDFGEYQSAARDVEKAKKRANGVIDSMQKDDRYAWLRGLTVEAITAGIRTYVPGSKVVLDNPNVKVAENEVAKITQEQASQIRAKLHDKLGSKLGDYLAPALRLGLALGRDLYEFSKNFPLLIFFDTYEEIDEGDYLLRMVMGATGPRVGWMIAGRDNLWAGPEQRERSIAMEYGYKDVVLPDRRLAVDFNSGGIGAFTTGDIMNYFAQICERVQYEPPLLAISEKEAAGIYDVTQGVPLAVKIAAGLYVETASIELVTEKADSRRNIVDLMVQRYLLHTRADQNERARLYGLALLRRSDKSLAITAALGLSSEQASTIYASELSRLHRRYSFIFTEKERPSLHQEVRYFLRLWLLAHCKQPEIASINERLRGAHLTTLQALEDSRQYSSLRERLEDEQWIGVYLDLIEQQFWLDPVVGVEYTLPFMLVAGIYRREATREVIKIGKFFEDAIIQPFRKYWEWATHGFIYNTSYNPTPKELTGLEELEKLTNEHCPSFSPSLFKGKTYQKQVQAALWWRLGEAYRGTNNGKALEWYEKALSQLEQNAELYKETVRTAIGVTSKLYEQKKYVECISLLGRSIELVSDYADAYYAQSVAYIGLEEYQQALTGFNRAIELDPNQAHYYNGRGAAHANLKEYQQALADFNRAIELDPTNAGYYNNRGNLHDDLKEYQQALADFNRAIELDPTNAGYYNNRGNLHDDLKEYQQALADFNRAIELDPTNAGYYSNRGAAHANLKEYQQALADFNRAIELDPTNASCYSNRGAAHADLKEYQQALADYNRAIELDPTNASYYSNRGAAHANLKEYQQALADYNRAIELDPTNASYYNKQGAAHVNLKEYQQALADYNRAIELDPTNASYYSNRGAAHVNLKEYQQALADYNRAIELDPTNASYYSNRGAAHANLKEYQQAFADYNRAIELDPTDAGFYNNRGNLHDDLKEYQQALVDFNRAIELDPTNASYYNKQGAAHANLKEYQQALADYNRAIELDPTNASYYSNRGAAHFALEQYSEALIDFEHAITLDEQNVAAIGNRGEVYRRTGQYEKALVDFNHAIELDKSTSYDWYTSKGLVLSYIGQYADAIKCYEQRLQEKSNEHVSLYNIAVVMARWKGLTHAQEYIAAARTALLNQKNLNKNEHALYGFGALEALAGNKSQALIYLGKAVHCGKSAKQWARQDIAWLDLRADPQFQKLINPATSKDVKRKRKQMKKK